MLQEMRDKAQGWVTWIILGVIIVIFALFGVNYYLTASTGTEKSLATVNGDPITESSFNYVYQSVSRQQTDSSDNTALQQQVLHLLINRQLLLQSAQDLGFQISLQQLDQIIYSIPSFQANGQFSMSRYQAILQNLGITTDQLRSELSTDIIVGQVQAGLTNSQFVLPSELTRLNTIINQKRDINYLLLPSSKFASSSQISQDQIQAYYEANQQNFYTTEQIQLQYIMLDAKALPKGQKSYADLGNQLANLTFENPSTLEYAANQLGLSVQNTGILTQAGSSGWLSNPQVIKAAFSDSVLKQGNNSELINLSPTQCVVVRVAKDIPATLKPLSQVQNQIVSVLQAQAGQQQAEQAAKAILASLKQGTPAAGLAKQYGLTWQKANSLTRASTSLDPAIIDSAFSTPQPQASQAIPVMATTAQGYAIVLVNKAYPGSATPANPADKIALQHALAVFDYDQYTNSLLVKANIKINS
ncbi:MAG: hypothetical protein K0Q57_719 [Gammaproteobacteria bacterium]|jgi:parvulin-like peptidyl-prolyl isomerase|nr:hypothetical protein [Gammaproteobacteria bacterium]